MNKYLKILLVLGSAGMLIGGPVGLYIYFLPHRDVQAAKTEVQISASGLVEEFLNDGTAATEKYMAADGDSKIIEVSGIISGISKDFSGQTVILLKSETDKAGVSCTLLPEAEAHLAHIKAGSLVTIKGVIRGGASYDADLELYENVLLAEAAFIMNNH